MSTSIYWMAFNIIFKPLVSDFNLDLPGSLCRDFTVFSLCLTHNHCIIIHVHIIHMLYYWSPTVVFAELAPICLRGHLCRTAGDAKCALRTVQWMTLHDTDGVGGIEGPQVVVALLRCVCTSTKPCKRRTQQYDGGVVNEGIHCVVVLFEDCVSRLRCLKGGRVLCIKFVARRCSIVKCLIGEKKCFTYLPPSADPRWSWIRIALCCVVRRGSILKSALFRFDPIKWSKTIRKSNSVFLYFRNLSIGYQI